MLLLLEIYNCGKKVMGQNFCKKTIALQIFSVRSLFRHEVPNLDLHHIKQVKKKENFAFIINYQLVL